MIRDALLALYGAVWGVVVVTTVIRRGEVTPELWAALGLGVGAILAAFRTDERVGRQRTNGGTKGDE